MNATKRVTDLAEKLRYQENSLLCEKLPIWIEQSKSWAAEMMNTYGETKYIEGFEGYRLLYILNRYCPHVYQIHVNPDHRIIQEDVEYNSKTLDAFLTTAIPLCDDYLKRLWNEFADVPFDDHLDSDMTLVVDWHGFPAGTEREDIWHWFDDRYSKGVYALLYE